MKKTLLVFFFFGYMSGTKTLSSFVGPTIVRKKSRLFSVFFGNYTGTTQSCGDYLINTWHCQDPVMKRPAVFLNGFSWFRFSSLAKSCLESHRKNGGVFHLSDRGENDGFLRAPGTNCGRKKLGKMNFYRPRPFEEMGVSKNRGTPKWMVYNGKPY